MTKLLLKILVVESLILSKTISFTKFSLQKLILFISKICVCILDICSGNIFIYTVK